MRTNFRNGPRLVGGETEALFLKQGGLPASLDRLRADMAAHRRDAARRETRLPIVTVITTVIGRGTPAVAFPAFLTWIFGFFSGGNLAAEDPWIFWDNVLWILWNNGLPEYRWCRRHYSSLVCSFQRCLHM